MVTKLTFVTFNASKTNSMITHNILNYKQMQNFKLDHFSTSIILTEIGHYSKMLGIQLVANRHGT